MLLQLAYIAIFLRLIPLVLQGRCYSKKKPGSTFFFLYTLLSFASDLVGLGLHFLKINTDLVFNIYQLGEIICIALLTIEIGNFKYKIRNIILNTSAAIIVVSIASFLFFDFEESQDYISGISKLYILILLYTAAIHYIRNLGLNEKLNTVPLIGLLGIFIFEALTIIPNLSSQLQRYSDHPKQIAHLYIIIVMAGNLIRDALISYNAILNNKNFNS